MWRWPWPKGQGHRGLGKLQKSENVRFLSHFSHYSYETWPVGSIWQDLSKHVSEDDLDLWVKVTGDMENYQKVKMYDFSATFHSTVMKLSQLVVCDKTFQTIWMKMTLTFIKVTKGQGHSDKETLGNVWKWTNCDDTWVIWALPF